MALPMKQAFTCTSNVRGLHCSRQGTIICVRYNSVISPIPCPKGSCLAHTVQFFFNDLAIEKTPSLHVELS